MTTDDESLDLARAFEDVEDLDVSVPPLDQELLRPSIGAHELQTTPDRALGYERETVPLALLGSLISGKKYP